MGEIDIDVLSQYDIAINKTGKGRGAIICAGEGKLYKLLPYNGTVCRLNFISGLMKYIRNKGFYYVDDIVCNRNGELISTNEIQETYILKEWFEGRECDVKNVKDVISGVETLALLHSEMRRGNFKIDGIIPETPSFIMEYERHNRELKKIRNFMRGRNRKTSFEYDVLANFDEYYGGGVAALEKLKNTNYEKLEQECKEKKYFCHGNYNYHNIIFVEDKIAIINFEKAGTGLQIKDLYFYMRKVLEKHNWNVELGYNMLDKYNKIRPISKEEHQILMIMLEFPEKFWKVVNQYYNSNKSWIPDKNVEKLKTIYGQQQKKEQFIKKISII